ncbi:MAG TPA: LysR family transcriptional regulator [Kofleriaceae bacterium]|nr:LysR family transcriptional regulator [Kofleriaceae bacterium]
MDLPFLAAFARVYETRNVTRAAAELHRSQPTVSYQIRRLEEVMGQALFVRRAAKVVPTPVADQLYRLACGFARDVAVLREGGVDQRASLELSSVSAFGRYILFPILLRPRFARRAITLRFPALDEVVRRVLDGQVDAGFVYRAPVDARLASEAVFEETFDLVANPTWARRLGSAAAFEDVPLVTYDDGEYVIGRWFGHHFGRRAPRWSSVSHFEEVEEVVGAVAAGRGVAILPGFCTRAARGKVRAVRWGRPPLWNTVFAIRRAGIPDHPGVAELLDALRRLRR